MDTSRGPAGQDPAQQCEACPRMASLVVAWHRWSWHGVAWFGMDGGWMVFAGVQLPGTHAQGSALLGAWQVAALQR
jgi:hypothetical protein